MPRCARHPGCRRRPGHPRGPRHPLLGRVARLRRGRARVLGGRHVRLGRVRAPALGRLGEQVLGLGRVGPLGRVLAQQGADDGRERTGVPGLGGLLLDDRLHGGERGGAAERRSALHRRVQRRTERPQVGGRSGVVAADALGREIVDGADDLSGPGDGGVALDLRDAEVGEQHPAVVGEQHVARFDVAVQDAGGVRGAQGAQHPQADPGRLPRDDPLLVLDGVGQRAAFHQLHDDPGPAVVFEYVVHGDDGRVVDPRRRARLAPGARQEYGLVALGDVERGGQFLDGDGPVQHLVVCAPHPAHAAAADGFPEPVASRDEPALHLIHVAPQWSCQGQTRDRPPSGERVGWDGNRSVTVVAFRDGRQPSGRTVLSACTGRWPKPVRTACSPRHAPPPDHGPAPRGSARRSGRRRCARTARRRRRSR
ncbi:hypothetical protein BZZ08_07386 [Streptomyces sp. MH60]|nr:hypothetical protein BZZ08_07386 [Streptomyces sp. MH60]